jgi:DNA-binding PadR family transcriptional regulator
VPEKTNSLSPGEWAVLGLLVEEPRHGFALAKAMAPYGDLGRVWALPTPLVYRALSTLQTKGLASAAGAERSDVGPQRLLVTPTAEGRDRLAGWLTAPVEHLRDVRSLLMLKLAFVIRMGGNPAPLLRAQAELFGPLVQQLERRAGEAEEGFDRVLMLWRLESARAAMRFLQQAPEAVSSATQTRTSDRGGGKLISSG